MQRARLDGSNNVTIVVANPQSERGKPELTRPYETLIASLRSQ
jgi:hypothetical protein